MNSKQLGRFLKKKRQKLAITQGELAKKLGFSSSQFISNIERGVADIPANRITDFAVAFGVETSELAKFVSDSVSDKVVKKTKTKLKIKHSEEDPFIQAFIAAWETADVKEKDCIRVVAQKVLDIDYKG